MSIHDLEADEDGTINVNYVAHPTLTRFHRSDKFVRTIVGPIGSGKSVACCWEMWMKSLEQLPNSAGIRKTRWVIVRNTYRELIDTTQETFEDWFPRDIGHYSVQNMKFTIDDYHPSGDGTKIHIEFLFRALDKPKDVKKLLSLEMTGMWINEAREIPKQIVDMGIGRLGRYPSKKDGGPTWHGLIMDTNPPDSDHWYYKLFEEELPHNHAIFHQPSGTSSEAENIENLPALYYDNIEAGKDQEWINVYVHGQYGFVSDGKPVYPEYNDDIHYTEDPYIVNDSLPLYIGIDFGLTPAASIGQITPSGCLVLFDELVTFDMGAVRFGKLLREYLAKSYPTYINGQATGDIEVFADPAGDQRAQTDEVTPFQILQKAGIAAIPTYTNDPIIRREVVAERLAMLDFTGKPAFRVCNKAKMTRKAFAGGYKYKRMQVTGEDKFMDKPDKNKYSHISDGVQYLALGAIGDSAVIGGFDKDFSQDDYIDRSLT